MADSLIDSIWDGKSCPDSNSHYFDLKKNFTSEFVIQSTGEIVNEREINNCLTEYDLVNLLHKHLKWQPIPTSSLNRFSKCSQLSTKLRERANASYKEGDAKGALRGYNLALAFAPTGSPELGLAYGNRSAVFFQLKEFSLAKRDVDLAFAHNFPLELKDKLNQRKGRCDDALKSQNQKNGDSVNNKKFCDDKFFTLKSPSEKIPRAENWVDIQHNEERGRRLVVTKDVNAGTLILIDKPFVSVINNLLSWDLQHCHHCSKPLQSGIPCETCSFTFYCNKSCRLKSAKGFHNYEEFYISYLQSLPQGEIGHRDLQALRIILGTIGPQQIHSLFNNFVQKSGIFANTPTGQIDGFNSDIYDCSYISIYSLISHGTASPTEEKIQDVFKSILLSKLLLQSFKDLLKDPSTDLEMFVSSLLLKHLGSIRYNAIAVSELMTTSSGGEISVPFATAVYPLLSLCNHSCDPNAAPLKKFEFLETSLVTLKNLKAGDEIFITYKPLFTREKTRERLHFLRENYNFVCKCQGCLNDLGPKSIKEDLKDCVKASRPCKLCRGGKGPCESCVRKHLQRISEVDDYEQRLHCGNDLLKGKEYWKATLELEKCLRYFTEYFTTEYELTQVATDLYKRAVVRLVNQCQKD